MSNKILNVYAARKCDMTTITSYSMPLIPLRSNLNLFGRQINEEACHMNGAESVLPRSLIRLSTPKEEQQMSPQDCYGSENSQSNSICDMDPRSTTISATPMHSIDPKTSAIQLKYSATDDNNMINSEIRSNSTSSYKGILHRDDDEDDYMNYCSDDSELSVGKEVDEISDRISNNTSDIKHTIKNRSDESSTLSLDRAYYQTKLPNIIRPNPTRQEEFLRKSQVYAEEIMKHQLNFMSVTKGLNINARISDNTFSYPIRPNAISPIHNAAIKNPLKIGFNRLQAYANDTELDKKWSVIEDRSSQSPEGSNFREIHSHLNAISKITSALGRDNNNRIQMTSPNCITSRENSQSPQSTNASNVRNMLHNNFNETNLKFSIDNILKPSFGRRITDPLLKRNKMRKSGNQQRISLSNSDRIGRTTIPEDSIQQNKM